MMLAFQARVWFESFSRGYFCQILRSPFCEFGVNLLEKKWVEIPFLDIKLFLQRNRAWVATTCWLLEKVSVVSHVIHHMATDRWPDNHWLLERSWKIQVLQKVAKYKLLPVELFASAFNTSVSYRYVQIISMFQGVICVALFWEGLGYRQPVLRLRTRSSRSLACCFGGAFTLESYNFSQKNHKPWVSWPSKLAILRT